MVDIVLLMMVQLIHLPIYDLKVAAVVETGVVTQLVVLEVVVVVTVLPTLELVVLTKE